MIGRGKPFKPQAFFEPRGSQKADALPVFPSLFGMPDGTAAGSLRSDAGEIRSNAYRTQEAPFFTRDFPLPKQVWQAVPALIVANLLLSTLGVAPAPVQARTFDVPRTAVAQPSFNPPNLLTGILPAQRLVSTPLFALPNITASRPDFVVPNLLETLLAPQAAALPFRQQDFPLPWRYSFVDAGEIATRFDQPFPPLPFEPSLFPLPATAKPDVNRWSPPYLQAPVVAGSPPFVPTQFGMPVYKIVVSNSTIFRPNPEDQVFPGQADFWVLPPYKFVQPEFRPPNLLETTLAPTPTVPFVQYNWNLPATYFRATDFVPPNLGESTLAPPFVPPTAENKYPLPPYKITYPSSEWIPNLLEGTLGLPPNVKPFGEQSFPLPYYALQRIEQKGWLSTIPPDLLPPAPPTPVVTTDQSTPGRIRHDWWKSKEQVHEESRKRRERIQEAVEPKRETYLAEGSKVADALLATKSAIEDVKAEIAETKAKLIEEGVKRTRKEMAAIEREMLIAEQAAQLLAVQQAVLQEEQEVIDVAYVALVMLEQNS